jgi:hypothetical protein
VTGDGWASARGGAIVASSAMDRTGNTLHETRCSLHLHGRWRMEIFIEWILGSGGGRR